MTTQAKPVADEVLAALKDFVSAFDAGQVELNSPDISQDPGQGAHPWHEEWLHYARAIIAKAEGGA